MTDDQLKQYWKEINTPYTKEELSGHKENRELKGLLELTHYDNYVLESLACEWYDYRYNGGKRPSRNIWTLLTPAHNQVNAACERLTRIVEIYCEHDYPTLEPIPILFFCSRSTATLIQRLEELHYTPHIDTLHSVTSDFFFILAGGSRRNYTRAQLREVLMDCIKRFTEACDANAKELHKFLLDFIRGNKPSRPATPEDVKAIIKADGEKTRRKQDVALTSLGDIHETVERIDNRDKRFKNRGKTKFSRAALDKIWTLWNAGKNNQEIKFSRNKKTSYEAVFDYYRSEFIALGVNNAEELAKAIKSRSNMISRDKQTIKAKKRAK